MARSSASEERGRCGQGDADVADWLTSTIATSAVAIPASASGDGRSPSTIATATGIATAQTAVVGATTDIVPIASARYRRATPRPPARPATAPQPASDRSTDAPGSSGSRTSTTTTPDSCDTNTTERVDARRDVRPPTKSAAPYRMADIRASVAAESMTSVNCES